VDKIEALKGEGTVLVFLSLETAVHSRSLNYFDGLIKLGVTCKWHDIPNKNILKNLKRIISDYKNTDCIFIVCSPSHLLVTYVLLTTRKRPYFDAGWPLYDGVISSRRNFGVLGANLLKTFFIDFIAMVFSKKIFVETPQQQNRIRNKYFIKKEKLVALPTGFQESRFTKQNQLLPNKEGVVVLFRGGDLIEAGIDVLIDAIKMNQNKNIKFVIVSNSVRLKSFTLPNTTFITNYVSDKDLNEIYCSVNIVLGQLSSHKRTNWTIPHKFYEAAYMGLPYLTSNSAPMLELSKNEYVKVFKADDSSALLFVIEQMLSDPSKTKILGINIKRLYEKEFSQYQLSNLLAKNII
jgi:hypothetical protein